MLPIVNVWAFLLKMQSLKSKIGTIGKLPAEEQIEKIKEIGLSPDLHPNKDKRKDVFREYLKLKRE